MNNEPRQWEFGSPLDEEGNIDQLEDDEEQPEEDREQRRDGKEKKSLREKIEEKRRQTERIRKDLKKLKKAPKQIGRQGKQVAKAAKKITKSARETAEAAARTARAAARASQTAARAAARSTQIAAQTTARIAIVATKAAVTAAQMAARAAVWLAKFVVVYWWLVIIVIIIVIVVAVFLGGQSKISSSAGGSIVVNSEYDDSEHQRIVKSLQDKRDGHNPFHKLVIYEDGENDIDWQCEVGEETEIESCTHKLDIRILKTLDYLTDRHELIEIGLLQTGAPDLLRESFLMELAEYSDEDEEGRMIKETISAFYNGQAIAIVAIDYSEIDELSGPFLKTPIEVNWQKTLSEKMIRPTWEELAYSVGFLDEKIPAYEEVVALKREHLEAERFERYLERPDAYSLYEETLEKISRITILLERFFSDFSSLDGMDSRTVDYFSHAQDVFIEINDNISDPSLMSIDEIVNIIRYLGGNECTELIREGARYIYKATQVANMVNWNKDRLDGNLEWKKAYEARNKVRQVIKELLEMPRETSLSGEPELFDQNLIVKQIVTFSPEDDLDNGLDRLDIFPQGIVSVDVGGVGIDTSGNDGVFDYMDLHFSYHPIDNGVFSKHGTNYIYKLIYPPNSPDPIDSEPWLQAGELIFNTNILGNLLSLHNLFASDIIIYEGEAGKKITYKDFLHIAF